MAVESGRDLVPKGYGDIRELFEGAYVQEQLARAVPKILTAEKLVRISLTVIRNNSLLMKCSKPSLMSCVMACAQLGLMPEPYMGQAYLVPFWSTALGCYEATFIPGYRGLITLARRSGELSHVAAQVVYGQDVFDMEFGLTETLRHRPHLGGDRGPQVGVYTVWRYTRAGIVPSFDFLPWQDLLKAREKTKSRDRAGKIVGPWVTDIDEMAKKTIIRRHAKYAALSVEDNTHFHQAMQLEEAAETGLRQAELILPPDLPLEVRGDPDPAGGDGGGDPAAFDAMVKADRSIPLVELAYLDEFIGLAAKQNGITTDQVKIEASGAGAYASFVISFRGWAAARVAHIKAAAIEDARAADAGAGHLSAADHTFRLEWKNMKSGYKDYVLKNLHRFRDANPILIEEAKEKFSRLVGEAWPEMAGGMAGDGALPPPGVKSSPAVAGAAGGLNPEGGAADPDMF